MAGEISDVRANETRIRAERTDFGEGLPRFFVVVQIDDNDLKAFTRQSQRRRAANALAATGNHRHLLSLLLLVHGCYPVRPGREL